MACHHVRLLQNNYKCLHFIYVTGFWKTDWIVTLDSRANGYTCTLHIHIAITRVGWLVYFSRANFADPVNSWVNSWRALHGRDGSEIQPSDREMSLMPSKDVWAYGWHFWDSWLVQTALMKSLTCLWLPTHPPAPPTSYNVPSVILQQGRWKQSGCSSFGRTSFSQGG